MGKNQLALPGVCQKIAWCLLAALTTRYQSRQKTAREGRPRPSKDSSTLARLISLKIHRLLCFSPNQRFTKVAKMLTQGETGIFSGTENRSKRDQLERLWISGEGRWPQGQETFVTGLSQGQTREADQRPRLWLPTHHPPGGLSRTRPLSFL